MSKLEPLHTRVHSHTMLFIYTVCVRAHAVSPIVVCDTKQREC